MIKSIIDFARRIHSHQTLTVAILLKEREEVAHVTIWKWDSVWLHFFLTADPIAKFWWKHLAWIVSSTDFQVYLWGYQWLALCCILGAFVLQKNKNQALREKSSFLGSARAVRNSQVLSGFSCGNMSNSCLGSPLTLERTNSMRSDSAQISFGEPVSLLGLLSAPEWGFLTPVVPTLPSTVTL